MLPFTLTMEIDLSAAAHKREVSEGFAKLRAELLPEPKPDFYAAALRGLLGVTDAAQWRGLQADLMPQQLPLYQNMMGGVSWPIQGNALASNNANPYTGGLGAALGLHGLW
jgi:hypothetical protein